LQKKFAKCGNAVNVRTSKPFENKSVKSLEYLTKKCNKIQEMVINNIILNGFLKIIRIYQLILTKLAF
jgi:hypothetical protein